jgi:hypothetical protein
VVGTGVARRRSPISPPFQWLSAERRGDWLPAPCPAALRSGPRERVCEVRQGRGTHNGLDIVEWLSQPIDPRRIPPPPNSTINTSVSAALRRPWSAYPHLYPSSRCRYPPLAIYGLNIMDIMEVRPAAGCFVVKEHGIYGLNINLATHPLAASYACGS